METRERDGDERERDEREIQRSVRGRDGETETRSD
jgi:hypothetical protein